MMMLATSAAQLERRASATSWLALLASAVAWSAQELTCFYVTALGCAHARPGVVRGLLIGISALALATTLAGGAAAYRSLRHITGDALIVEREGRERREMIALVGVFLGIVLTIAVIWGALPSLLLSNTCGTRA